MPRGCRPCNGADVARDWRDCPLERGIVGPFEVGSRKKVEPLRQTHLATIHIHVHTLINLSEIKSKANPIKKSMIPVPCEGRVTFSPPIKYALQHYY